MVKQAGKGKGKSKSKSKSKSKVVQIGLASHNTMCNWSNDSRQETLTHPHGHVMLHRCCPLGDDCGLILNPGQQRMNGQARWVTDRAHQQHQYYYSGASTSPRTHFDMNYNVRVVVNRVSQSVRKSLSKKRLKAPRPTQYNKTQVVVFIHKKTGLHTCFGEK